MADVFGTTLENRADHSFAKIARLPFRLAGCLLSHSAYIVPVTIKPPAQVAGTQGSEQ